MTFTPRLVLACAAGVTAIAGPIASAAYQMLSERADRRRFPPPGQMIDVQGRRLHVWLDGEHNPGPTVVVVPAMTSSCLEWIRIQRKLIGDHRVFMYDRGGVGWSDWVPGCRDVSHLTDELEAVLAAANVPGPYVLVGHSLGGGIARLFTYRHPRQVAGLVLVDSIHEGAGGAVRGEFGHFDRRVGDYARWRRAITHYVLKPRGIERARVRLLGWRYYHDWAIQEVPPEWVEASVAWDLSTRKRREAIAELTQNGRRADSELARARRPLGDLPLTVICRAEHPVDAYGGSSNDREFDLRWWKVWFPLQQDLAGRATAGRLIVAERAGHNIQHDDPQLIIDVVADMCTALVKED